MDLHTYEKEFFDLLKRVSHYVEAIALMHWDLRTGAPKKALMTGRKASDSCRLTFFKSRHPTG